MAHVNSPWTQLAHVEPGLNQQMIQHFKGEKSGFIQVGPKKYLFPKKYAQEGESLYNFEPRSSDVWVVTFPRSGTTWTQEMVWLLSNNLDYTTAAKISLPARFPFYEFSACINTDFKDELIENFQDDKEKLELLDEVSRPAVETLSKMKGPRFIKTHLPFSLLPPQLPDCGAKIIYVARNPKDVAVSFYHLHCLVKTLDFVGDFDQFWDYFERDLVQWAPYWSHLEEGWQLRHHPNIIFFFYEDMKKNLKPTIQKLSSFLGKKYSDDEIDKLCKHVDISNFRQNPSVNCEELGDIGMLNKYSQRYVRSGEAGGWRSMFSEELNNRADKWIQQNIAKTELKFPINL